jgi:hypothetical protein
MPTRKEIREAYAENFEALKRTAPNPGLEDIRLCVEMAAEQTGHTYEQARSEMIDVLGKEARA